MNFQHWTRAVYKRLLTFSISYIYKIRFSVLVNLKTQSRYQLNIKMSYMDRWRKFYSVGLAQLFDPPPPTKNICMSFVYRIMVWMHFKSLWMILAILLDSKNRENLSHRITTEGYKMRLINTQKIFG